MTKEAIVITIATQKGGVGKTTAAVNIAHGFVLQGKSVLLVDLDSQGNATFYYGVDDHRHGKDLHEAIIWEELGFEDEPPPTSPRIVQTDFGVDIMPGGAFLAKTEAHLHSMQFNAQQLDLIIERESLREKYDYIIFDTAPSLGPMTFNAFVASDRVIIAINCDAASILGMKQTMRTMKRAKDAMNQSLSLWGILPSEYDVRNNLDVQILEQVQASYPNHVLPLIRKNIKVRESVSFQMPVVAYDKNCSGAQDYTALTKHLHDMEQ
jgi:chromosome partitioning protein